MPPDDPRERCPGRPGLNKPCKNWPWSHATKYCRNHDPALDEQRRHNGRVRTKTEPAEPNGWRAEWQRKEDRRQDDESHQRLLDILEAPLPANAELREETLRILRCLANDERVSGNARVGACARLLEATEPPKQAGGASPPTPSGDPRPWMRAVDDTAKQ